MDVLLMIIYATIVLGLLVFIHEGGHYLAARAFGVRVTEFMLGLPGPSLSFKHGETRFGVTAVLLGGYAKVCGMEAGEMSPHLEPVLAAMYRRGTANMEDIACDCGISDDEALDALDELVEWGSITGPTKRDEYNTYRAVEVKPTKREIASAAAAADASAAAAAPSVTPAHEAVTMLDTTPAPGTTPAPDAPLSPILSSYAEGEARPVTDAHSLFESEYKKQYRSLPFWKRSVILLAGVAMNLLFAIVLFIVWFCILGADVQTSSGEIVHVNLNPLQAIQMGFYYIWMVVQAVVALFNPATAAQTVEGSSSVIGIAVMSKSAFDGGIVTVIQFFAMISVSLGVMNLVPIPPLDGGRFVVEIFQKISRKVVSTRALNYMSAAGMALFLGFFLIMANQDIQRFVFGNW